MKVLFICNEPGLADQTKHSLEEEEGNFKVETTCSGKQGLKMFDERGFDAVVADYKLPDMNGLELLKKIKKQNKNIPFIMLTNKDCKEVAMGALSPNADRYIKKERVPKSLYNVLANEINESVDYQNMKRKLKESEEKYRTIFEKSGTNLIIKNGRFVEISQRFVDMLGYTEKEIIGKDAFLIVPPEEKEKIREKATRMLKGERSRPYRHRVLTKNGKTRWVIEKVLPITYENDQASLVSFLDITEYKGAERKFREFFKSMPVMCFTLDGEGIVREVNKTFCKTTGFNKDKLIGSHLTELKNLHPEKSRKIHLEKLKKTIQGEKVPPFIAKYRTKNGETRYAEFSSVPLMEDGRVKNVIVNARDITERKKSQERENFLHSLLRHDLKNNIRNARGYLKILNRTNLSGKQKEILEKVSTECKTGSDLIKKVRTLREIDETEIEKVRVKEKIQKAVEENRNLASEKGIKISYRGDGNLVRGGPLLTELFRNLIENSILHSHGNRIIISEHKMGEEIIIRIDDDGQGIPDEEKSKIFERGYRKGKSPGTGVGLYLVNKIAQRYQGKVKVRDSKLGGAQFEVQLKGA